MISLKDCGFTPQQLKPFVQFGKQIELLQIGKYRIIAVDRVPVMQIQHGRTLLGQSIFFTGTDWDGKRVIYAREETSCIGAGQTYIYWEDCKEQMTHVRDNIPTHIKIRELEKVGDIEGAIKVTVDEVF